jgi:hypothetical protein
MPITKTSSADIKLKIGNRRSGTMKREAYSVANPDEHAQRVGDGHGQAQKRACRGVPREPIK